MKASDRSGFRIVDLANQYSQNANLVAGPFAHGRAKIIAQLTS
jgi:hypothetical protein